MKKEKLKCELRLPINTTLNKFIENIDCELFSTHQYIDYFYIPNNYNSKKVLLGDWNPSLKALRIRTDEKDFTKGSILFSKTKMIPLGFKGIKMKLNELDTKCEKICLSEKNTLSFQKKIVKELGFKQWFTLKKNDGRAIRLKKNNIELYCEKITVTEKGISFTSAEIEFFGENKKELIKKIKNSLKILEEYGIETSTITGKSLPELVAEKFK
jgi:adenylate cyclase class IV